MALTADEQLLRRRALIEAHALDIDKHARKLVRLVNKIHRLPDGSSLTEAQADLRREIFNQDRRYAKLAERWHNYDVYRFGQPAPASVVDTEFDNK